MFFHKESLATNVWNVNFRDSQAHLRKDRSRQDKTLQDSDDHVKLRERSRCAAAVYDHATRMRDQEIVLERREDWYMHNGKQVRDKPYLQGNAVPRSSRTPTLSLLALKGGDIDELELQAANNG